MKHLHICLHDISTITQFTYFMIISVFGHYDTLLLHFWLQIAKCNFWYFLKIMIFINLMIRFITLAALSIRIKLPVCESYYQAVSGYMIHNLYLYEFI